MQLMNAPCSEALSVLSMEGMIAVFCSLVENMPYVVAEVLLLPNMQAFAEFSAVLLMMVQSSPGRSACRELYKILLLL